MKNKIEQKKQLNAMFKKLTDKDFKIFVGETFFLVTGSKEVCIKILEYYKKYCHKGLLELRYSSLTNDWGFVKYDYKGTWKTYPSINEYLMTCERKRALNYAHSRG